MSFYETSAWQRLRTAHLSADPWCRACLELGYHVAADHVDHIETVASTPERRLDPSNLQSLCASCHSVKTTTEDRGGPPRGCLPDGTPRDPDHHWHTRESDPGPPARKKCGA